MSCHPPYIRLYLHSIGSNLENMANRHDSVGRYYRMRTDESSIWLYFTILILFCQFRFPPKQIIRPFPTLEPKRPFCNEFVRFKIKLRIHRHDKLRQTIFHIGLLGLSDLIERNIQAAEIPDIRHNITYRIKSRIQRSVMEQCGMIFCAYNFLKMIAGLHILYMHQ